MQPKLGLLKKKLSHGCGRVPFSLYRFHDAHAAQLGRHQQGAPSQEAVVGEAGLFRQYAKEAMHVASEVTSDLACTWAVAAFMSDRILGAQLCFVAVRRR
jgi:hypothetical protein